MKSLRHAAAAPVEQARRAPTRRPRVAVLVAIMACLLPLLAGCGVRVHSGTDTIAVLRGDALWVLLDDGSGARAIASSVAGYAWSPDHHELAFRVVGTSTPLTPLSPTTTRRALDAPGALGVASINGGVPLQITPSESATFGDPWWDAEGNRLVYRETGAAGLPIYVVSQADQPVGIARKPLLRAASVPAIAPDGKQVAVIDASGAVRVGAPGDDGRVIANGALLTLPAAGRPARLLWQPTRGAVLYPTPASDGVGVALRLIDADAAGSGAGTARTVATVDRLLDAAFSPDGSHLLVRTPDQFQLWPLGAAEPAFTWTDTDAGAMPWWSPDGRYVLVQDASGWQLVDLAHQTVRAVLRYASVQPTVLRADWRPASGSPWSADGTRMVFAAGTGDSWGGHPVPPPPGGGGTGLYVAAFAAGSFGAATAIDGHSDAAPSWSYLAPSTTFLVSA